MACTARPVILNYNMIETRDEMALRHVLMGREILAAQQAHIDRLRSKGSDTNQSERVLALYEQNQAIFEGDLAGFHQG
jgi:hypothetical protein